MGASFIPKTASQLKNVPAGNIAATDVQAAINELDTEKQASLGFTPENVANKDATGGYTGLTLFKINFKNVLNTIISFLTNSNTVARIYTFQNRDGTIADDTDLATKQGTLTNSAGLAAALSDETGTGLAVFNTSPTLVTPALGTPASGVLTNMTGLPTAGLIDDAVTYAKMQNISATDKVLGRATAGAGDAEEITCTAGGRVELALILGAANLRKFVNAAGTGVEWAVGIKSSYFSIDTATASGNQAVTGVGFKPSHVIFFSNLPGTSQVSMGFNSGDFSGAFANEHVIAANAWTAATPSINLIQASGITYTGVVATFDVDGFTIAWTKTGAKTGVAYIYYMAFR